MAIITRETLKKVTEEIIKHGMFSDSIENRKIVFSYLRLTDEIPVKYAQTMEKIAFLCYDNSGLGYHGVATEIHNRVEMYSLFSDTIKVSEFFVHRMNQKDMIDKENNQSYEMKSGTGTWLYSKNPSFEQTIRNYSRRKEIIRWDYTFFVETKKAGKAKYHVFIETSWKQFFAFLTDYNGSLETWFKENSVRSGIAGVYKWDMNTINTSKKKADYLLTFAEWEKAHR